MLSKMRLKKAVVIFGSLILVLIIFMIYSAKDLTFPNKKSSITQELKDNQWLHFEDRIKQLENDLSKHHNAVYEIKVAMQHMLQPSPSTHDTISVPLRQKSPKFLISDIIYNASCPLLVKTIPKTDIQMLELYKTMSFENIDGGDWKQGWRVEVDEKDWNRHNKLKVFVVPHSHNDPGWIKTVDEYYLSQTKHILQNMLQKLPEDPRRKFIWAEISYFSMWWDDLDDEERQKVKKLLNDKQLEIVTGGWVMNDEANSHWISVMHQLTEGHQWLQRNLNYTPKSHWSIDPFGMGMIQPELLKEMGLKNMLIQRVHYSVKKQLASTQQLEFRWRQLWDGAGKTDMFTHLMPFYAYDIPHTCGPSPKICCQFDFKRLPNHGLYCPWKIPPKPITEQNVAERAALLLDQYRKKSKLYKTNVVIAPLGDDFRYDHPTEWDVQYENYQKLFDYMNSNLNLNVQAQFGTLSDYFVAVRKEKKFSDFPVLTGDFFTYADRNDHYWSGYYTSRPFYKRMDRVLLSYIRAAEIIHTLAYVSGKPGSRWLRDKSTSGLERDLTRARQSLSLFQHHDGITGTAKDHVVVDYGKKMIAAIRDCQNVIQHCVNVLLGKETLENVVYYNFEDVRRSYKSLEEHNQITIGVPELPTKNIVVFNDLTFTRHEIVTFFVNTPFVEVMDFKGKHVNCQVSPVFEHGATMSQTKYQLSFMANVPALSLVAYKINAVWEDSVPEHTSFAQVKIFNQNGDVRSPKGFVAEVSTSASEFTLQNARVTASFNTFGLLKALKVGTNTVPVHLDFARYGVRHFSERSGAYLFLPDGDAVPLQVQNTIVNVIEGHLMSSVTVQLPYVRHTAVLYNSTGADGLGIEVENIVDIQNTNNFELVMRLSTNIKNGDEFFTDVNGYQIVRRKRFEKLPLQANYYPMPTTGYIEDANTRLTVLTGSPLGASSLTAGQLEVMQDRRLNQDDNLGLGQGVMDNHPTRHVFRIILERKTHTCQATVENHPAGFPSIASYVALQSLLNPLVKLLKATDDDDENSKVYVPVQNDLGVDFSVPTFKTGVYADGNERIGLLIQRQLLDVCFADRIMLQQFPLSGGVVNISNLFPPNTTRKVHRASLSFLSINEEVAFRDELPVCPMQMETFVISQ